MPADDEVEAAAGKRQLLGVGLLEADRKTALGRLAPRLGQHGRGEVDAGDPMTARDELEAEEARAAAGIECIEGSPAGEHEIENSVPGGALSFGTDAVAEILVKICGPPAPVLGNLLLDR